VSDAVEPSEHRFIAPIVGPDDERRFTDSGIEVGRLYDADDVAAGVEERLGEPGSFPFTRGIHDGMYRDRLWTMRQYAGFSSPEDTNERYRYLIEHGSTGLSMAFDLPTQLGRDSDDPLCDGEVGRTGVPIDTIEDMRICFDQIPLDQVSTSMTINAPAAVLLLLYELVGEEQDVGSEQLRGTVQNDVLKEYMARGNYIYPPEPTMRLTTDIFEYCQRNVPKWNTISISGYHIREKGCSAVQEVAFTLSNAIAYVEAALARGLDIDAFAPRLAFFFNCHNNVFQEVAKFRAVRRMWAEIVRDRFGSENPRSQMIRFHTQTGGVTLQAQQPEVNIIRVALQGFAAVAGGTQSLHTNGFDEALALPTERSARIALRTQQVIAYESGATETVDPFAGSYFIESLTDEIEMRAKELMTQVEEMGGSVESLDFMQREIEESAASYHERYKSGQDIIVGVNKFVTDTIDDVDILKVDPEAEKRQVARLAEHKQSRDQAAVDDRLADLTAAAEGDVNLLPPMKEALRAGASIGEVCGTLREVFGEYRGGAFF
jgi:methylmalonyl-CoA mutase N-terminal domain/subunit